MAFGISVDFGYVMYTCGYTWVYNDSSVCACMYVARSEGNIRFFFVCLFDWFEIAFHIIYRNTGTEVLITSVAVRVSLLDHQAPRIYLCHTGLHHWDYRHGCNYLKCRSWEVLVNSSCLPSKNITNCVISPILVRNFLNQVKNKF